MASQSKITLKVDMREVTGKKVRALRKQGITPAVIYGSSVDTMHVQAPSNVVAKVYSDAGKHHPVYLTVGGKNRIAMIKDVDMDPVKRTVRHVSFHAVKANEPVEAVVPIHLIGEGESAAEKAGLVVLQALDSIEVKALPTELPDALEVDITALAEPSDRVTVADIKLPDGVELVDHAADQQHDQDEEAHSVTELVVASVYEPSALQAANDAAGGDAKVGDEAEVGADNGEDTDQGSQDSEDRPGGKGQDEPKQSNVDQNK